MVLVTRPRSLGAPTTSYWIGMSLKGSDSRTKCLLSPPCISKWHPPRRDFLKCNIDATAFENSNSTGFSAILRDSRGTFIPAKATPKLPFLWAVNARHMLLGTQSYGSKDGDYQMLFSKLTPRLLQMLSMIRVTTFRNLGISFLTYDGF
ncbi:hypothetical protein Ccrd_025128 [Cynara cardunculus var. scolymus]|uniref:Uncharacterized protein n=1 Tax=Cynara cardunculus var. scolymus TaxID=59895 RepID=A0A124SAI4_CYNCS|nr:hypothetical protein Ccrd_025128 [Cynara cardunculus var. scolymus]